MLKATAALKKLLESSPDCTEIFADDIFKKYSTCEKQYDEICLADYATNYTKKNQNSNKIDDQLSNDDDNDNIDNTNKDSYRSRQQTAIIRYRRYKLHQDPDNYYREQILLFMPWRNEKDEVENIDHASIYNKNQSIIEINRKPFAIMSDEKLDNAYQQVCNDFLEKEKLTDDDDDLTNIEHPVDIFEQGGADLDKMIVVLTAASGKAAYLINGMTLHTAFSLPLNQYGGQMPELSSDIANQIRSKLMSVKLIIMDEVSMIGSRTFNLIDVRLRQITGINKPFGNISIIVVGDFMQLPPVRDRFVFQLPNNHEYKDLFDRNPLWDGFRIYELTQIMRQKGEAYFIKALNNLAVGKMTDEDIKLIKSREVKNFNDVPQTAIRLFATNEKVNQYNDMKISETPGTTTITYAKDILLSKVSDITRKKTLDALKNKKLSDTYGLPYDIKLKEQIKYMVTLNIDIEDGFVNGACGTLKLITFNENTKEPEILWIEFLPYKVGSKAKTSYSEYMKNHDIDPKLTPIKKKSATMNISSNLEYKVVREQFPVVEAEAMTIHKSQGQSCEQICVTFSSTPGMKERMSNQMMYVALSRVKSINGLFIIGDFQPLNTNTKTKSDTFNELQFMKSNRQLELSFNNLKNENAFKIIYQNVNSLKKNEKLIITDEWYNKDSNNLSDSNNQDKFSDKIKESVNDNSTIYHTISDKDYDHPSTDSYKHINNSKRCLEDDDINLFLDLMNIHIRKRNIYKNAQNVIFYFKEFLDDLTPNPNDKANIQILFDPPPKCDNSLEEAVGHWICTKYDGREVIHIYDSLNLKRLNNDQINYLNQIYPFNKEYHFHLVQQQPDGTSCGVFAIYFATLLSFGRDPDINILKKTYDVIRMRNHVCYMLNQKKLLRFPEDGYQSSNSNNSLNIDNKTKYIKHNNSNNNNNNNNDNNNDNNNNNNGNNNYPKKISDEIKKTIDFDPTIYHTKLDKDYDDPSIKTTDSYKHINNSRRCLEDDDINLFLDLVNIHIRKRNIYNNAQNVIFYFKEFLDDLTPNPNDKANIQILFDPPPKCDNSLEEAVGHWICTKYDEFLDDLTPNPNDKANIQILFDPPPKCDNSLEEAVGHWICTKYDGKGQRRFRLILLADYELLEEEKLSLL
ncbi:uncharacterized protein [Bactrocera oleae]|uniref:uncharacterized protein n=1 Tax=Bactrocera oleae TaxID=104688 RepID=UPI00387EE071